ncbi:hypothetical protein CHGG_05870 [Chaetomium globosum CBS 148.51]|uniref:AAA+ ATPase lid domain-containing protein n=1 Tax=Chaetomium globosum (strain ATCC 6205 / CBS 148.51 / DSM 1962 / NBRC 6347 / NRRL 1970) TaxID=306901 RepID=Q2H645_CHAGB|nr:uncharacterized protein CHGG_05870 [Chaetomium globosum CBS 148.51]EAQ89251.1 hypothetical protein CHGG_05870 [Chaetomium globosum CBS 148.51]
MSMSDAGSGSVRSSRARPLPCLAGPSGLEPLHSKVANSAARNPFSYGFVISVHESEYAFLHFLFGLFHLAANDISNQLGVCAEAQTLPGKHHHIETTSTELAHGSPEPSITSKLATLTEPELVRYKIEYAGRESGSVFVDGRRAPLDTSKEHPVFEYVDVRLPSKDTVDTRTKQEDISKTDNGKGHAYINILSPSVAEALRCVVDYFPDLDFSENIIKIPEPYSVFVFFEKELTEYRERVAKLAQVESSTCPNRWAAKHIAIVQDFTTSHGRTSTTTFTITASTSPMLSRPYNSNLSRAPQTPTNSACGISMPTLPGLVPWKLRWRYSRFAGEKRTPELRAFPCEYLRFADDIDEEEVAAVKQYFVNRGKKWYNLRRGVRCSHFDGFTIIFPRRDFTIAQGAERRVLSPGLKQPSGPLRICTCADCGDNLPARSGAQVLGLYQDIGVKPETIEANLLMWFKAAENWGAIMLIDEADIYMEQRQIHYPEFEDEDRDRLWDTFFHKLEEDREATMRITQTAKDYVQSQELRALRWNGREIRNAFQVAVALAEAKNQKDKEGRVVIQSDHIKASVHMSREFGGYLAKVHKGDLSKRASLLGNRYDAFGKEASGTTKY